MASQSYSSNIAGGAFLPTQGMSFAGAGNARVYDWKTFRALKGGAQHPVSTQLPSSRPMAGSTAQEGPSGSRAMAAATAASAQNVDAGGGFPTTAGGLLRPGAIDQSQFKAMLAAASAGAPAGVPMGAGSGPAGPLIPAATGRSPIAPLPLTSPLAPAAALAAQQGDPATGTEMAMARAAPAAGNADGIQTLTAAQFAALTGVQLPQGASEAPAAGGSSPLGSAAPQIGQAAVIPADALTMSDASIPPDGPEAPAATAQRNSTDTAVASSTSAEPATRKRPKSPHGTKDENGVLLVTHIDRDTRREYAAKGIKWKLVDDPEADRLFFGEDGKLGWDDVVDLINPLQHIPLVNVIYRKLTGDKINGAAELLGAIPFGPFSTLSAITNIAVREASGRDIGSNVLAMITGEDGEDDAATAKDLAARDTGATETAAARTTATETSAAAIDPAAYQTAGISGVIRDRNNGRA